MPGSPTKSKPLSMQELKDKIKEEAVRLNAKVTIKPDGSIYINPTLKTGVTLSDGALNNYYTILKKWSDPLVNMIMQINYAAAQNHQKNVLAIVAADKAKQAKLIQLLNTNTDLQQITANGYTKDDILQGLISLKKTPAEIFNSGYEITYGAIKLDLDKFDSTQKADFNTWENSIERSDKCVPQGKFGLPGFGKIGSKSTCYIKDGKYISKGGRRKRSVRQQYRRSRKVSRK